MVTFTVKTISNHKKAASVLMMIFEVLVVLGVAYAMLLVARGFAQGETITKVNLAQDMAMMIHTLASVPGDAIIKYPPNVSKYTFVTNSSSILVMKKDDPEIRKVKESLILPEGYTAQGIVEERNILCIEKKSKRITIKECAAHEP